MDKNIDIKININEEITVVKIIGTLCCSTFDILQNQLSKVITSKCNIILDVSNCNLISNSGIRAITTIIKVISANNGQATLIGLSEEAQNIMKITGFENFCSPSNYDISKDGTIENIKGDVF